MSRPAKNKLLIPAALTLMVSVLWAFPHFWYSARADGTMKWLKEETVVPGWGYRAIPVDEAAEKALVADRTVNGIFTNSAGSAIQVFSAKRFDEKANEIGLFIHTPDRCWVEVGWKLDPDSAPTYHEIALHGSRIPVERRIFTHPGRRELVYFFGLQDGSPLPYRLDHYLSTGLRSSRREGGRNFVRASDAHFWARLWDSFKGRRQVMGPKQFIRLSTAVGAEDDSAADRRLETFLQQWLTVSDYKKEKEEWRMSATVLPR